MAKTASVATRKMIEFLNGSDRGLNAAIQQAAMDSGMDLSDIPQVNVADQNVSVELSERSETVKYPRIHVYADRVKNLLTEKFRDFSGTVRVVAEVRVSQDRIEQIEDRLRLYTDSVTQVLDWHRGAWGEGTYFMGRYQVDIQAVKRGGLNFLQIATVTFELDVSA